MSDGSKGLIGTFSHFIVARGIGVDQSTGDVYVVDKRRLAIMDGDGDEVASVGSEGSKGGQFKEPQGVAVDQSTRLVYVTDRNNKRVDVFSALGAFEGAWGENVDTTTPGTGFEFCPSTDVCQTGATSGAAGGFGTTTGYPAVNPTNGNVVVADAASRRIDEFSVTMTLGVVTNVSFVRGIGWGVISNASNELQTCTTGTGCVTGLAGAGSGEFGASGPTRVAVDGSGLIYATDPSNARLQKFNAAGTSASVFAEPQLSGAPAPADVAVDLATNDVYVTKGVEGEQRVLQFDETGATLIDTHGVGDGLAGDNGLGLSDVNGDLYVSSGSSVSILNTLSPPSIGATNVTATSATLNAAIAPGGADATYDFEYGTSGAYGNSVPTPEGDAGAGRAIVQVHERLEGLQPDTTYHFRAVATALSGSEHGVDRVFTTERAGAGPTLPDGRGWEMVSPPDKHGSVISPIAIGEIQASTDGSAITYFANGTVTAEPAGNYVQDQILSRRAEGSEWVSQNVSPPHEAAVGEHVGLEDRLFSGDLSSAVIEPFGATPLSPETTEETPYIRDNGTGLYRPLVTAANVPPGTKFSEQVEFVNATLNFNGVILSARIPLTETPGEGGLYEWAGGKLQLVSVLPGAGEEAAPQPVTLGGKNNEDIRNALSPDGNRVVWTSEGEGVALYLRDVSKKETTRIDTVQPGGSGAGVSSPSFQTATGNDSKVFFTDGQQLTSTSKAGSDLYEFDAGSNTVTDLVGEQNPRESANVQGLVLGAGEDGTYVYFVAQGILTSAENGRGERAFAGGDNLYVMHESGGHWTTTFLAALSSADRHDWAPTGELESFTARVSPNGRYLAFMSNRGLTEYDNHDASTGERDQEAYLYDAISNRLICASCDSTGARPQGVLDTFAAEAGAKTLLVDRLGLWSGERLAGDIPGWVSIKSFTALHQPRYLSDSGRLFFDAADALVPQDVNHAMDVYEYEPGGVGDCTTASPGYSAMSGGCVELISSGTSGEESAFLDAGETGGDVFFLTAAPLASTDVDTALDVYDAHVCSAAAPCAPPATESSPCATEAACRPPQATQPAFGDLPSAFALGSGNVTPQAQAPPGPKPKPKAKRPARRKRKHAKRRGRRAKRSTARSSRGGAR
jgi:hypothetical protein